MTNRILEDEARQENINREEAESHKKSRQSYNIATENSISNDESLQIQQQVPISNTLSDIAQSEYISDFLYKTAYDQSQDNDYNIEILSKELTKKFQDKPSIRKLILGSRDEDGNHPIESWKVKAVCKALEVTKSIKELDIRNCTGDSALELSIMLQINDSLRSLIITEYEEPNAINGKLLANGIKLNKGLKSFDVYYENEEGIQEIVKGVQDNHSLIHFINCWGTEDFDLNELLSNNQNLTHLRVRSSVDSFIEEDCAHTNINKLSATIKSHPNLYEFMLEDNDYRFEDPLNELIEKSNIEVYTFLEQILLKSRILEMVSNTYIEDVNISYNALAELMETKSEANTKFIKALRDLNGNTPPIEQVRNISNYEKIGKNFVREKLKEVDWKNNNLIRKYADIYDFDELKQYDSKIGLSNFTKKQQSMWKGVFKQHVAVFDDDQDAAVNAIIYKVEKYRNDKFFHLKAITKDITQHAECKALEIWSKIASYCESPYTQTYESEGLIQLIGDEPSSEEYV